MKMTLLLASIGVLALATSTSSLADARDSRSGAGVSLVLIQSSTADRPVSDARRRSAHAKHVHRRDRERAQRGRPGYERGMRVVKTAVGAGEPGDGWRYFSHPAASRAVVISPQGDYFFSQGQGLTLVAATQPRT